LTVVTANNFLKARSMAAKFCKQIYVVHDRDMG